MSELETLERAWHDKIAELRKIGQAIAQAKEDPYADPFEGMRLFFFEQERINNAAIKHFSENFIKPLP